MDQPTSANAASSSNTQDAEADPWKHIPLPSIADVSEQQVMDPKTLLACCRCAKKLSHEHDLSGGDDTGINIARTLNHPSRILERLGEMTEAAKKQNWEEYLLGLVNVLH